MQSPVMQETFTQNHVGDIPVDIRIGVQNDSAVLQHEEFEKLAELARSGFQIPPDAIIRSSRLRNKKEILAAMNPPPDPMQQQMAMLQLALLQAQVEKTRAEAAEEQAKAQDHLANIEFKLGPQASKTSAQAMEAAAKAGSQTVPDDGATGEQS
jgi:hypothetical protein